MGGGNLSWGLGICPYVTHLHSLVSYRGIYLLNTLTKLFEGLMEKHLSKFTELHDTLTPSQQGSRIARQTNDAIYVLIPPYKSDPNTDSPFTAVLLTLLLPTHRPQRTLGSNTQKL